MHATALNSCAYHVAVKYKTDLSLISANFSVASRSEIFITDMNRNPTELERATACFAASVLPKEDDKVAHLENIVRISKKVAI